MKGYGFAIPFLYFIGLNVLGTLDLIYRKQKYQDYLSRLEALKKDGATTPIAVNQELAEINNRLSDHLVRIKQLTDQATIQQSYYILGIPVTLLLIYQLYKSGFSLAVFFLVLLLVFYAIVKYVMKALIAHNKDLTPSVNANQAVMPSYLHSKLSYVNSGLDIKKYRVILLGIFYITFFPCLLYYASTLFDLSLTSATLWLISHALSVGYWIFYFNSQLSTFRIIEEELTTIDHELSLLLTQ